MMHARSFALAVILLLATTFGALHIATATTVSAANLAQEEEAETGDQGGGEDDITEGEPSEETGAGEGETQETSTETGPPWTYQMAKILLVLVLLMAVGIAFLYYRLVVQRRQGRA